MSVNKKQVLATATLARLDLSREEQNGTLDLFASQMEEIVGYMDILSAVDTEGVAPLYSPIRNTLGPRDDVACARHNAESLLANAPEKHDTFFVVPPVL